MKKNMRKALSWIMILCMVLSMVPAMAIQVGAAENARTVNGSYENGQGIVNHGLVVNREKGLGNGFCHRIQTATLAAG